MVKLIQTVDGYVLKTSRGYIGLDNSSGGYPYIPSNIKGIHVWNTAEEANSYKDIMSKGSAMGEMGHANTWQVKHIVILEIDN